MAQGLGGMVAGGKQIPCMQWLHGVPMYIAIQLIMDLRHPGRGANDPFMHGVLHGAHTIVYHLLQLRHTSKRSQHTCECNATCKCAFLFPHSN